MNDPHVEALYYSVAEGPEDDYDNAPPFEDETDDFVVSIEADTATFKMKSHYATVDEARPVVESYLRRWEVIIGLEHAPGVLAFAFSTADVVDRAPPEGAPRVLGLHAELRIRATVEAKGHVSHNAYPSRPGAFFLSPDVEVMYERYKDACRNREKLLPMVYFCLTTLERRAGSRDAASRKYRIGKDVLKKLGELTSAKGSPSEARKAPKNGTFVDLSSAESHWLRAAVKAIIRRAGEMVCCSPREIHQLTMDDLPPL